MSIVSLNARLPQASANVAVMAPREQRLQHAAEEFEALFLQQILKQMRKAGDVLAQGNPMRSRELDTMRDFYDEALAETLAQRKQTGIADLLVKQLGRDGGALPDLHSAALAAREASLPARNSSLQGSLRSTWQRQDSAALSPLELDELVSRVIAKESSGNSAAVSPKGARGLMQLMPDTARDMAGELGIGFDEQRLVSDPDYNQRLGTAYLQRMLERYDGNQGLALAAYNAGPGKVDQWLSEHGDPRRGEIGLSQWIEQIPYQETRDYARTILRSGAAASAAASAAQSAAPAKVRSADLASALSADSGLHLARLAEQQLATNAPPALKSAPASVALSTVTHELPAEGAATARLSAFAQPVRVER
jgi:soluble lytic murein transglycosylase